MQHDEISELKKEQDRRYADIRESFHTLRTELSVMSANIYSATDATVAREETLQRSIIELNKEVGTMTSKLDTYLKDQSKQTVDIDWIKGYIKVSLSAIIALFAAIATTIFEVFIKQ